MKAIKDNIVGLFRFIMVLFSAFLLPKRTRQQDARSLEEIKREAMQPVDAENGKYKTILGSPSKPLVPTETVFCPKCHVAVAQIRGTKQGTEIIRHGRVLVTVGGNVMTTKDGKEEKGFPIKCPNGHTVRIE